MDDAYGLWLFTNFFGDAFKLFVRPKMPKEFSAQWYNAVEQAKTTTASPHRATNIERASKSNDRERNIVHSAHDYSRYIFMSVLKCHS